jgi:methionyl-tRNA formyltransferase
MRIIFFGTPEFAATVLEELVKAKVDIVAIVTKPDKPQGRSLTLQPTSVKETAQKLLPEVPLFQPLKCSTPENIEVIKQFRPDLFVVVAYGEIMSQALLDAATWGGINIHASLLPSYRGAAPIQRCLMNGDTETGISIIRMVRKLDAGDVLCSEKLTIPEEANFGWLEKELRLVGTRAVLKAISDIEQGKVTPMAQDPEKVTFADKITPQDCCINWQRSSREIHNLVRALSPHPGAWCQVSVRGEKKRLKILKTEVFPERAPDTIFPGMFLQEHKSDLMVTCGRGILRLFDVQLEGKPVMPVQEFLKGFPLSVLSLEV